MTLFSRRTLLAFSRLRQTGPSKVLFKIRELIEKELVGLAFHRFAILIAIGTGRIDQSLGEEG